MFVRFRQAVERCNTFLGYLSGLGILVMGIILFYEVVCRYFFNSPTIWVQEVAIYLYLKFRSTLTSDKALSTQGGADKILDSK